MKKLFFILFSLVAFVCHAYTPSDSLGVYAVRGAELTRIENLPYNIKVSNKIVNVKSMLEFKGEKSVNQFCGKAILRIYFGIPSAYDASKYYMFSSSYSVNDFRVVKFKVKKGKRYLTTSTSSVLGGSIGAKETEDVQVEITKIKDNVYELIVSGEPGEYGIAPTINGLAGYAGVFDFGLLPNI